MKVFFVCVGNSKTNGFCSFMFHPLIGKFEIKLIVIQYDDKCPVLAEKLVCDCDVNFFLL